MLFSWAKSKSYIKGTVFVDLNCNCVREEAGQVLEGIRVKLFSAHKTRKKDMRGNTGDVEVYREKLIGETTTNSKGEYRFEVYNGYYSLNIDLDTLPDGMGVVEPNIFLDKLPAPNIDFAIRDIKSVEINRNLKKEAFFGDIVTLGASAKDKNGNILAARLSYSSDSRDGNFDSNRLSLKADRLNNKKIGIKVSAGQAYSKFPLEFKMPDANSVEKVKLAFNSGIIDQKEKITNLMYSMFDKDKLPQEFRSDIPIKSGTSVIKEINDYLESRDADPALVKSARGFMSLSLPKLDMEYASASGFFKIHYTISGDNAVSSSDGKGIPEYIRQIGDAFDYAKSITCGKRGFKLPILEEGKKTYDVYVYDLKGKYGVTMSRKYYTGVKYKQRVASSYISIDNSYSSKKGFKKASEDCMRVTAAHEFFHAVQYAYNVDSSSWWKEASATWNEDEIFNGVNDYIQYLGSVFSTPYKSLEENSYGGVAFVKYISEKWGGYDTIKRIWEIQGMGIKNSINAIDEAIKGIYRKEDIGSIYNVFTAWNFNPSQYYEEGKLWNAPLTFQNTYTSFPIKLQDGSVNHLAANYQMFKSFNPEASSLLRIIVDSKEKIKWGFKIQRRRKSDNLCEFAEIPANEIGSRTEIICEKCGEIYSEICLIPANLEKDVDKAEYIYSVALT